MHSPNSKTKKPPRELLTLLVGGVKVKNEHGGVKTIEEPIRSTLQGYPLCIARNRSVQAFHALVPAQATIEARNPNPTRRKAGFFI